MNTFGNHDISYGDLTREEVLEIVKKCNPNYVFSDTYYAFSPKTDYRIIVLDPVITEGNTANGNIPEEQLVFLDNELSQNQDKIVLIAMHHPSVEPFAAKEHSILNADSFNEILLKYKNPIIVVTGHYHAAKIRHMGNLVFVSSPAMVTYPMAFRHIKITNFKDRVNYEFEFIPTRLDDVKELNRQSVISYGTLAGFEKDRNTSFVFKKRHPKSISYKRNKIKSAAKTTKTKKSEIKKLSQPKLEKVKGEKIKKEKQPKAEKIKAPKIKKERPAKVKNKEIKPISEKKLTKEIKPKKVKQPKAEKVKIQKQKEGKPKKEFNFLKKFKNKKDTTIEQEPKPVVI